MADQVDSILDAELRTKLAEHGFPIMLITPYMRKLLVKNSFSKLVLDNKTKPRNSVDSKVESRRSLARYSSGEESDLDTTNAKEKRGRRTTTGGFMLPPRSNKTRRLAIKKDSPVKRDSDKGSKTEEDKSPVRIREKTVTTRELTLENTMETNIVNNSQSRQNNITCKPGLENFTRKLVPPYKISKYLETEINCNERDCSKDDTDFDRQTSSASTTGATRGGSACLFLGAERVGDYCISSYEGHWYHSIFKLLDPA